MIKATSTWSRQLCLAIVSANLTALCAFAPSASLAATGKCETLSNAPIKDTAILSAQTTSDTLPEPDLLPSHGISAKNVNPLLRGMPAFCRVKARLSPVKGSVIGVEMWLPEVWNGKLLAVGNHGFGGEFERGDMAVGLRRGYAVISTDLGHPGTPNAQGGMNVGSAVFAQDNEVAIDDFAWRANHEMTVAAKNLVELYYGVAARRSYFLACSNGGRQAMREVQQFPADYDGVIAGSAGMNWTGFMAQDLWQYQAGALPSGKRLSAEAIALAHKAVVSACDRLDGLADGLIANPLACHWKPDALLCKTGSAPGTCLSAEEIAAIERIEAPMRDPRTGEVAYYGMAPGSELLWTSPNGQIAALNRVATDYYRYMVARDPKWSATDGLKSNAFDIWRASKAPGTPGARIDSINPDIAAFRDRGGKLIQYHGWSDQAMSPGYSVKYYSQVVDKQPGAERLAKTQSFYRLFMAPGMAHCYGGEGPTNFGGLDHDPLPSYDADHDVLEALDRWVENGVAPKQLVATEFSEPGVVKRQMPLCPYPQVAMYVAGDPKSAKSFQCKAPSKKTSRG